MTSLPPEVCERTRPGYHPPPMDRWFLLLSLGLIGLWLFALPWFSWGSLAVLATLELTYLFGCSKTRKSTLAIFPSLYAPYVGHLMARAPQGTSLAESAGNLLQAPGNVLLFGANGEGSTGILDTPYLPWLVPMAAIAVFLGLVTLGRIGPKYRILAAIVAFAYSLIVALLRT